MHDGMKWDGLHGLLHKRQTFLESGGGNRVKSVEIRKKGAHLRLLYVFSLFSLFFLIFIRSSS